MSFPTVISRSGPSNGHCNNPEIQLSACLDCGTPLPSKLLELARMDLTFITDRPLRYGTPLQLAIYSDFINAVTHNRANVHWCRPHPLGLQIGAFLTQSLPDRITENHWTDLRSSLRYECNWKAWVLWGEETKLEAIKILNYSINGLCMLAPCDIPANQDFSLFGATGSRESAVLRGQTQWCRSVEGRFQIGGLIHGQRGRDLPRMFGNLKAVHADGIQVEDPNVRESLETQRCEQELREHFLTNFDSANCPTV